MTRTPCTHLGRRGCTLGAGLALLMALGTAHAADTPPSPPTADKPAARPRIGLVLGGGGAKGAAHIGVLKVLEELRIPVDCIAGTSMGSLVGAAYATGMSSGQLEKIVTAVNWKDILASAPRQEYPIQRKKLDFIFTNGLELGIKDGEIVTPAGLVPTHQIEAMFRRIVAGAGEVTQFDRLPIPFRAVATDLETGQMVVFDRGDLAVAMRASMAVPGAFAPVETGGKVLVDGMLVRNLPVDVARQTCADVIIAVPVANPAITRDKLNRLTSVAGQAMNIAVEANEKAQLATLTDKDVPIPVILKNIGSSDFAAVPEAMPIGEAAARAAAASLARYSLSPEAYARWRAGLRELAEAPAPKIDEVRLSGLEVTNSEVMKSFVQVQPGDTFSHDASDADATRLVARGDFTVVSPQVDREGDKTVLTYRAAEKPWGPDYLQFDLNLSTDLRGDTGWGIRVDYQKRWLNRLGGEIRVTGQVGRPNAFGVEYYQPIDLAQRYFVSPTVSITQTLGYVYSGDTAVTQLDQTRAAAGLDLGSAFGSWGEARLGLSTGYGRARTTVDVPWLPDQDKHRTSEASLRFYVDTLDQALFPSSGVVASGIVARSLAGLGAEDDYQRAALNARAYYSVGVNVWSVSFRGGTDFGGNLPAYIQFRAGGLFNLSGYRQNELTGQSYAVGTVQLRRRIGWLDKTLGSAAWAGTSFEFGNVFERTDGTSAQGALAAGSVYLGVSSRLGPIYFGYGLSEGGRYSWYLYLGSSLEQF